MVGIWCGRSRAPPAAIRQGQAAALSGAAATGVAGFWFWGCTVRGPVQDQAAITRVRPDTRIPSPEVAPISARSSDRAPMSWP